MTNTILTCFKDDSIHGWEADTLEYKFLLPSSSGPPPRYRAFAASSDGVCMRKKERGIEKFRSVLCSSGRILAAGGRASNLHLWNVEKRRLMEVLRLPPKMKSIKQLFFLNNLSNGAESQVRC